MLDYERQLIIAVAQNPQESGRFLMSPRADMGLGWFESLVAKKFFSALADLSLSNSDITLSTLLLHRDDDYGAFAGEEIQEIIAAWRDSKTEERVDIEALTRNIKSDNVRLRAQEAIGKYQSDVTREPHKVMTHLDSLGGRIAMLSHSGVEYDANPMTHLEEPQMTMRGNWGANNVLDKMFSRSNTEESGGKPAYGLAIASMPTGSGKCLTGDAIIFTDRGAIRIGEYDKGIPGFSPMTIPIEVGNGVSYTSHFYNSGVKPIKRIKTHFGYSVRGTYNHPVLTIDKNGAYHWIPLEDVSEGTYIAISRKSNIFGDNDKAEHAENSPHGWATKINEPDTISEDDAYIFGVLIGNGGMTYQNNFVLTEIDEEVISKYQEWANKFGVSVGRTDDYGYRISSLNMRRWLAVNGIGYHKSIEKEVPFTIMRGSKSNIKMFLRGLFDTDGSTLKTGSIEWCSSSDKLANQVHILLTRFGITGRVRTKKTYAHDAHVLSLNGDNALRFYNEIGFGVKRKQDRMEFLPAKRNPNKDIIPIVPEFPENADTEFLYDHWVYYRGKHMPSYNMLERFCAKFPEMRERYGKILDDWYFWDVVTEVEEDGEEECYDVTVPDCHSFVSNGIVSHNTTLANTLTSYSLAYSDDKVVIMSNEMVRSIYANTIFNAMKSMYAGTETDDRIKQMIGDKLAIYAPSSSREHKGINVSSFEDVRRILFWEKPQLAIMDSINGVSAPQFASRMSENKAHEAKADAFRDMCLEFGVLMYAPGNMSEEHQKILKSNKPDKLQSVMLFGSTAYQNASDWCFLGWRDYSQHGIVNIKRTKNRHGSSIGERWQMQYDFSSGIYRPAQNSHQFDLN